MRERRKMNSDTAHLREVLYDFYYRRLDKNLTDAIDVLQEILKYVKHINKDVTDKSGFVDPMENLDFLTKKLKLDTGNIGIEVKYLQELYVDIRKKEKKDEENKLNKGTQQ